MCYIHIQNKKVTCYIHIQNNVNKHKEECVIYIYKILSINIHIRNENPGYLLNTV